MTNDNSTRKKANAVFFSAIMVVSMLAVGFAAAPAAAATGSDDVTTEALNGDAVAASLSGDDVRKVTHFVNSSGDAVIEFSFTDGTDLNETVATSSFSANVTTTDDQVVELNENNVEVVDDGRLLLSTGDVFNRVDTIEILDGVEDEDGNEFTGERDVRFASETVDTTADGQEFDAFEGSLVALESDVIPDQFDIEGPNIDRTRGTGENSNIFVFNTDGLATGEYNITNGADNTTTLELNDLGLAVEVDEEEFEDNENITGTATSETIDREVDVELVDDDGDVVETTTGEIDAEGELDFSFGEQDTGVYSVEVTDINTGVTAVSDDFEVVEAPEGDVSFEESFVAEEQGDIAEITIEFEGDQDEAFLRVGDSDDVGYEANISVESGGEDSVTIGFNTYTAGSPAYDGEDLVTVVDDDSDASVSVEDEEELGTNNILAVGTYPMDLSEESFEAIADDESVDVGDLDIEPRGVTDFQLWTTSQDAFDDVEDADDILDAAEEGTVQQTDTVVGDDVLVHDLQGTGLEGLFEAGLVDENEALFPDEDGLVGTLTAQGVEEFGIDLRIRQTADTTAPNQPRKTVDVGQMIENEDVSVIESEDRFFIAFAADDIVVDGDRDVEDGDAFNVRLRVKDERLLDVDDDEFDDADEDLSEFYEVATVTFSYEDAEGEFTEPIEVEADEDQQIAGTTNVAPGQEITVRARSASGVSPGFVQQDTNVVIDSEGAFEAELDFSEASVGDEFTATVRSATFDAEEDGIVVEGVDDEDEVDDVDETDDADDVDETDDADDVDETDDADDVDETDDVDDTDEVDDTEDDTPGFGAVVALVALIAAALLATRRTNN